MWHRLVALVVACVIPVLRLGLYLDVDDSLRLLVTPTAYDNSATATVVVLEVPHHSLTLHHLASSSRRHHHAQQHADEDADHPPHRIEPSFVAACLLGIVVALVASIA